MRLHIALLALAGTLSPVVAGAQAPAVDFATSGYRGLKRPTLFVGRILLHPPERRHDLHRESQWSPDLGEQGQ
jgi:hypothetical protein